MKQVARTAIVSLALGALSQWACIPENPNNGNTGGSGGRGGGGGTGGGGTGGGGTGGGGVGGRAPDGRAPDRPRTPDGRAPDRPRTPDGRAPDRPRTPDAAVRRDVGGAFGARMAVAEVGAIRGGTVTGRVTFMEVENGVQMTYSLDNCPPGPNLTHIHLGTTCDNFTTHWGRGEDIGGNERITCGADRKGTLVYTRPNTPANLAWTIGGAAASNIEGRPVIIHVGTSTTDFQGCGLIRMVTGMPPAQTNPNPY